jgi:CHASE3 domain sensor protein
VTDAEALRAAVKEAERAGRLARVALIVSAISIAVAILGMFLPIS